MCLELINSFVQIVTLTETDKSLEAEFFMGIGETLDLNEIESVSSRFKACPKCNSEVGFWLGFKRDHAFVQCKGCGAKFELSEVYAVSGKGEASQRLKLLRH